MLKNMFKKTYTRIDSKYRPSKSEEEPNIPEGLWRKCNKCSQPIYVEDVKNNYYVCPKCGGYFRVHARRRIEMIADEGTFEEWNRDMEFSNPLDFPGYEKKVLAAREKTGLNEAVITGKASIDGHPAVIGVCDSRFLMSSMGYIVGEKITGAVERATKEKLPVIFFVCSGGARMQEGMISLMQMAKTSAALKRHQEAGQLYITVLTDPTTGGVTASFAMLGDIILAEPKALIGFAGPRVIEQTIGQKLPEGFQRSEFLLEHGFVDKIVERHELKDTLVRILRIHENTGNKVTFRMSEVFSNLTSIFSKKDYTDKSPWETVILSRKSDRPTALDYIEKIFDDFMEFHGDRYFKDDGAIAGGIAMFHGIPVTVIGQQKGRNTKDNIKRNFGMPSPEGYRKALRLMKQAEQFHRPVVCFVDTPGAFCGLEAEERGQGEAIARNLFEMSSIKTPILSIVIGEGGSGGALAMAVANQVWMMENSVYSVLSPEGFASILWKDSKKAPEAARVMKMTARDLKELNLIEHVVPEKVPASMENLSEIAAEIDTAMRVFFNEYQGISGDEAAVLRYERFRRM
ncbi:MAG: acetyl-CoA carboxylase carboxyltransferase subunit beta [Lachnospiraceae bacterium]|nr:acetyl-CoA carboxylase carboxyltransferase subunit beta [Lachnospiraceae bacterium]MCI9590732.1 acetyl-CoA carboxylase carboxyltransferase subunit beta [Lachnospiraceae bacterium]